MLPQYKGKIHSIASSSEGSIPLLSSKVSAELSYSCLRRVGPNSCCMLVVLTAVHGPSHGLQLWCLCTWHPPLPGHRPLSMHGSSQPSAGSLHCSTRNHRSQVLFLRIIDLRCYFCIKPTRLHLLSYFSWATFWGVLRFSFLKTVGVSWGRSPFTFSMSWIYPILFSSILHTSACPFSLWDRRTTSYLQSYLLAQPSVLCPRLLSSPCMVTKL